MKIWILSSGLTLLGCGENLDIETPTGALHLLRNAVVAGNMNKTLQLSSTQTRTDLTEAVRLIGVQRSAIQDVYPPEYRMGANGVYPRAVFKATNNIELFSAFVGERLNKLPKSKRLIFGLSVSSAPVVMGKQATVPTHSGESIGFALEAKQWKTTAFEALTRANLERIRANSKILSDNLLVLKQVKVQAPQPN
jgi:hypothetical protein